MKRIGDKTTLAFETSVSAEFPPPAYLIVDIYIANKLATVRDNTVFVSQFLGDMRATHRYLKKQIAWLQYRDDLADMNLTQAHLHLAKTEGWLKFLDWGPTTDDISCHLIVYNAALWITAFLFSENSDYEVNDPLIHGARISPFDLIETLEHQILWMQKCIE